MSEPVPIASSRPLVLASASPRRAELLAQARIPVEVRPADVDEAAWADEDPRAHARRLAGDKARAARAALGEAGASRWILAADTLVLADGGTLGKPADAADAARMLRALSGRTHTVVTAYAVLGGAVHVVAAVETRVAVKPLDEGEIARYVATGEPMDKAGAYGIQGIGVFMVSEIQGSYTNVVGLPLAEVIASLRAVGALGRYPP